MSATAVKNESFDDIVFESRNKAYGAFLLRTKYGRSIIVSAVFGMIILTGIALGPVIAQKIKDANKDDVPIDTKVDLADLPKTEEDAPPPPPPPPPPKEVEPPKIEQVKFTEPEPTDEKIEEPPPINEDNKDKNIGEENVEGDDVFKAPEQEESGIKEVEPEPEQDTYDLVSVQQKPEFPGGEEALLKYLASKIKYPDIAREAGTQGTVYVSFVVGTDGKPFDVKVGRGIKGVGAADCGEEAVRAVRSMPAWNPGKQNGRAVKVPYTVPVKFTIGGR